MLGQPSVTWEIDAFLRHFKFPDLESAIHDKTSMNAVLCATFAGDVEMVRFLARQKADINMTLQGLRGLDELGYTNEWNLLMVALESRQSPEMILGEFQKKAICRCLRFVVP